MYIEKTAVKVWGNKSNISVLHGHVDEKEALLKRIY